MKKIIMNRFKAIKSKILILLVIFNFSGVVLGDDVNMNSVTLPTTSPSEIQAPTIDINAEQTAMQQYAQSGINNYLPIRTPELTPGDVPSQSRNNAKLMQPIFLVGSDDRSKSWLQQNHDQLIKIKALGLLIQADTQDDITAVQQLAKGLVIIPAPASELITQYGLTHYPVLITQEGITQ